MPAFRRFVALLLFGSGFAALIYQTAWQREFRLVFGASTAASAAVLAVFLGGLGFGGLYFGKRIERSERPLEFYGNLELGVALTAAASPLLIDWLARPYWAFGGSFRLGFAGATIVRLLIATLGIGPSVFLMGGTLPAAARAVEGDGDRSRRELAVLYGTNTIGAVCGSLLGTFFLFELVGVKLVLWGAVLVNLLIAVVARAIGRARSPLKVEDTPSPSPEEAGVRIRATHAAAFIAGFSFLLLEVIWYRLLAPILGGSTYTFGLVLAVALLGIGLGGWAYAMRPEGRRSTLADLAFVFALEGACVALPIAAGDRIAIFAAAMRAVSGLGFAALVISWAIIAAFVIFPAAFVSGYAFPLLFSLAGEGRKGVARDVGTIYAFNTAGSILGSLLGGFILVVELGAVGSYRLVAVMLVVSALSLALLAVVRNGRRSAVSASVVVLLSTIALMFARAEGPTAAWRFEPIGAGRVTLSGLDKNGLEFWINRARRTLLWHRDGVETAVGMTMRDEISLIVDGKSDGSVLTDRGTQVMLGLTGAMLHPNPRRALVIGLGTGMSAGWLAKAPSVEAVDVVELERSMATVAKTLEDANQRVLDSPNVQIHFGDAREWVLATKRRYDVIVSEPSNPFRAGISALFTLEYYEAAAKCLNPGGIYVQWVQGYEVDADALRTVLSTLRGAFPHVTLWHTQSADLMIVASADRQIIDIDHLRRLVTLEPFKTALVRTWLVSDVEGVLSHFVASDEASSRLANVVGIVPNTDDQNALEYAFARSVGTRGIDTSRRLVSLAAEAHQDRPALSGASAGAVDWDRVAELRPRVWLVSNGDAPRLPMPTPRAERRALSVTHGCLGRSADGYRVWLQQDDQTPHDDVERFLLGLGLSQAKNPRALDLADELAKASFDVEAELVRATFAIESDDTEAAMDHEERALSALRKQPFPLCSAGQQVIDLSRRLVGKNRSLATRAARALLAGPFATRSFEETRLAHAQVLADTVSDPALCVAALGPQRILPRWEEEALKFRKNCLTSAKDPFAAEAERDLIRFQMATQATFSGSLGP
jgi:spermidine synthase